MCQNQAKNLEMCINHVPSCEPSVDIFSLNKEMYERRDMVTVNLCQESCCGEN